MDFGEVVSELSAMGYKRAAARAKIAHDVVLAAIRSSGMKGFVTIKGGVVMSGITKAVRRATMDMDVDFVRRSISTEAIEAFVAKLDAASDCSIAVDGKIVELRQQEYRGKRVFLRITDGNGYKVLTKVDVGVHAKVEVAQRELLFDVVTDERHVKLLSNSKEQIFVEKLKSLLRLGTLSSRYKDVYDMYYLIGKMSRRRLGRYFRLYIYQDKKMRERDTASIVVRLAGVFGDAVFKRQLRNKKFAWLDVSPLVATKVILDFIPTVR